MARAELLQFAVEVVLHRSLSLGRRKDNDPAVRGDLNPRDIHTSHAHSPYRPGDIRLPK
jgi:hypothetical protein